MKTRQHRRTMLTDMPEWKVGEVAIDLTRSKHNAAAVIEFFALLASGHDGECANCERKLGMPFQPIVFDAIDGALVFGLCTRCAPIQLTESNPTIERITFKLLKQIDPVKNVPNDKLGVLFHRGLMLCVLGRPEP